MVKECRSGKMGQGTKVPGSATKQMATASLSRQMAMFMKACGLMTKHMGRVNLFEKMEASTRDNGPMISSTVKG